MRVAVIIPCYNEELTIAKVVADCRKYIPEAEIYVFDNNSKDKTSDVARHAGAHVVLSRMQGKGHVIRHAFREVDADVYFMVDGDDTYSLADVRPVLHAVTEEGYAMAVGTRLEKFTPGSFRPLHLFGNRAFSRCVGWMFGHKINDIFSGYRVLSRQLVERLPLRSSGFEIEAELSLQTISSGLPFAEFPIRYGKRPEGSHSKLRTFTDGFLILQFIAHLARHYKPMLFFGAMAFLCFIAGIISGIQPIQDYIQHAYVYTVPRAVLAASLMVLSGLFFGVGLILDSHIRYLNNQLDVVQNMLSRRDRNPTTGSRSKAA